MDVGNKSTSPKEAGSVSSKTVMDPDKAKVSKTFDYQSMEAEKQACSTSCSTSTDTNKEDKWASLKTTQEFDYGQPKTVMDPDKAKVWASLSTSKTFDYRSMKAEKQACSPSCSTSTDTDKEDKWASLKTTQEFDYGQPKTVMDPDEANNVWASFSTSKTFDYRSMNAEKQACSPSCSTNTDTEEENKWASLKTSQEFDYGRPKPMDSGSKRWNCNLL
ncbi:hypothetical protein [Diadegma fenestrale ichnovirus]|uniref:Uncharacterized protein n=1 Tax=Diadegma fenestrale ichnovirus TaxID=1428464 RepID=A0A075VSD0_9VIRU|nr:hypothetical protein A4.1 [Diadegma fenestrale ichnovirus]ULM71579.1 hypothetical protein [Diadegma fenestrale ichnovirus]